MDSKQHDNRTGLSDKQKKNITFIIEHAEAAYRAIPEGSIGTEPAMFIDLTTSEIELMALVTADELEDRKNGTSFLLLGELAGRLKEIATLCLAVQENDEDSEIKALVRLIREKAESMAAFAGLRTDEPPAAEEPGQHAEPDRPLIAAGEAEPGSTALQVLPEGEDDVKRLRAEVRALRELLASLVLERDNLVNVVLRDIEAAYMRELGGLEVEAYRAECEARTLKARLELMQANLNRGETIREAAIDESIRQQYAEYQKVLDEFIRRIFEANAYSEKRAQQKTASTDGSDHSADTGETAPDEARVSEMEEQELKRLYRKIVKAMHPDLHPNQDEATKELFKRAIIAYKEFDLRKLREIAAIIDGEMPDDTVNITEALQEEKARLLELIHGIRAEVRNIKSCYPYTQKELLDDPVKLAAEKEKLRQRISSAKEAAIVYQERIEEMRRKYGRTDPERD